MRITTILLLLSHLLFAQEVIEAIYKKAYSDITLAFTAKNIHFKCSVAGIKTVSSAIADPNLKSSCLLNLVSFQHAVPLQKHSSELLLHDYITYHVEPVNQIHCKVYLNAGKTYAQKLLELGYAKVDTKQKLDPLYMLDLKRSQKKAMNENKGIWKKKEWQQCVN